MIDTEFRYRGLWDREPEAVCRVRVIGREHQPPIVVLSELAENPSTSVTNAIEYLTAEVISTFLPHRWDAVDEDPAVVIEHYSPQQFVRKQPTYDRVTFARWQPRLTWFGQQQRPALGKPEWRHLPLAEVRALLGTVADDLPGLVSTERT